MAASWSVIQAMAKTPIPLVAALRETNVVFAELIGVILLRERLSLVRIGSLVVVLAGLALTRL